MCMLLFHHFSPPPYRANIEGFMEQFSNALSAAETSLPENLQYIDKLHELNNLHGMK